MAGVITMIGTLSIAVSLVSAFLAGLINNSNWLLARILIFFVHFLAHEPGASLNVADLRTLASPPPAFVVAPLPGRCLSARPHAGAAWLFNTGRETDTPSTTWRLLQYHGINRLDGLVLAQVTGPDNDGAEMIARDFQPRRLAVPVLRTRSPLEKDLSAIAAQAGREMESWQRGQTFPLGTGVEVEVLGPAPDSAQTHAEDRALVLLFHCGGQSLLWAGRIGREAQQELLTAYPQLHADVLVMGSDPLPSETWFATLGARDWLDIPAIDPAAALMTNDAVCRAQFLSGMAVGHDRDGGNSVSRGSRRCAAANHPAPVDSVTARALGAASNRSETLKKAIRHPERSAAESHTRVAGSVPLL